MDKKENAASVVADPQLSKFLKSRLCIVVEECLNVWIHHQWKYGAPVTYNLIQKKAKEIYDNVPSKFLENELEFSASIEWVSSFLQRNRYHVGMMYDKPVSVDVVSADLFKGKLSDDLKGYDPRQIFTADETPLFWRSFAKTHLIMDEAGIKDSRDRITILFCCNAVGFKLRPACVYRINKPQAFKNIQMNTLPVWWKANSVASLTATLFDEWFFSEFMEQVKAYLQKENLPQKAILLIDNEPGHPKLSVNCDENVQMIFIPPNAVSLLHPFQQGIISTFKRHYASKLIQRMVSVIEKQPDDLSFDFLSPSKMTPYWTQFLQSDDDVPEDFNETLQEFWNEYTVLKCIYDIIAAWNEISEVTIMNSFGSISTSILPAGFKRFANPAEREVPMVELVEMFQRLPGCSDASENDLADQLVEHHIELASEELALLFENEDDIDNEREDNSLSEDYARVLDKIRSTISAIEDEDPNAGRSAFMVAALAKMEMEYQSVLMKKNSKATCRQEPVSQTPTNETASKPLAPKEPQVLPYFSDIPISQVQSSDVELVDIPDLFLMDLDKI
ncbi:tigger transposable element-derived protein 1-like [Hetaerina americana]|uniref:tigger transposable element-derived protein 1-like n=1 Tax=Hetaerina americana TaxID=62018 RepID=UPI003A7F54F9